MGSRVLGGSGKMSLCYRRNLDVGLGDFESKNTDLFRMENTEKNDLPEIEKFIPYKLKVSFEEKVILSREGSFSEKEMSFEEVFSLFENHLPTNVIEAFDVISFKLCDQKYRLKCPEKYSQIYATILELYSCEVNIYSKWYFYAHGSFETSSHYYFFLVDNDQIVHEKMMLSEDRLFKESFREFLDAPKRTEWTDVFHKKAVILWHYQMFYTQTKTGQIEKLKELVEANQIKLLTENYSLFSKLKLGRTDFLLLTVIILLSLNLYLMS